MSGLSRRAAVASAGAALLSAGASRVRAADDTDAAAPIRALNDALLQAMRAGRATAFAERVKLVEPAVLRAFDLPQILHASVGQRWAGLPAAQQAELADVFQRYTVASYVANFDGYGGQRFEILPDLRAVGQDRVVQTRIVPPAGDPARIDYQMRQTPDGWRAVDVLLDGTISRVAVQRSDFRALVAAGDAASLIASLRAKIARLEAGKQS